MKVKAVAGTVIVRPLYDKGGISLDKVDFWTTDAKFEGHEIRGILMAGSVENPMSQQGEVLASGIDEFIVGMHALYMPYHGEVLPLQDGDELLCIPNKELVAWLEGREIMPRRNWHLVRPEFPSERTTSGLYIPDMGGIHDPVQTGSIVRAGADTTLSAGTRVVIEPNRGFEVGIDENLYVLHENHILATIETNADHTS